MKNKLLNMLISAMVFLGISQIVSAETQHSLQVLKSGRVALPGGFSANDVTQQGNGFIFMGIKKNIDGKLYTLVDWDNYGDDGCKIQLSTREEICRRLTFTKTDPRPRHGLCISNFGQLTMTSPPKISKSVGLADHGRTTPSTVYYVNSSEAHDKVKKSLYADVVVDLYCE